MKQAPKKLFFRPHHFMCNLGFQGKGYSPDFVDNFQTISDLLKEDDSTLIEVVKNTDSICGPCPHRLDLSCEFQQKISELDERHQAALGLTIGAVISWKDAKKRIRELMSVAKFHEVCIGCAWKDLGVCEGALKSLKGLE